VLAKLKKRENQSKPQTSQITYKSIDWFYFATLAIASLLACEASMQEAKQASGFFSFLFRRSLNMPCFAWRAEQKRLRRAKQASAEMLI
jgi:hypothetical protein